MTDVTMGPVFRLVLDPLDPNANSDAIEAAFSDPSVHRVELSSGPVGRTIHLPGGKHMTLAGFSEQPVVNVGDGPCVRYDWKNSSQTYGIHVRSRLESITLEAKNGNALEASRGGKSLEIRDVWCVNSSGHGAVISDAHGLVVVNLNCTRNEGDGIRILNSHMVHMIATSRVNRGTGFFIDNCNSLSGTLYGEANSFEPQIDFNACKDGLVTLWGESVDRGVCRLRMRMCSRMDLRGIVTRDHGVDIDTWSAVTCTVEGKTFLMPNPEMLIGAGSRIKRIGMGNLKIYSGDEEVAGLGTRIIGGYDITVEIQPGGGHETGTLMLMHAGDLGMDPGDLAVFRCRVSLDKAAVEYFKEDPVSYACWLAFAGSGDSVKPKPLTTLGEPVLLRSYVGDPVFLQLPPASPDEPIRISLTSVSLTKVR